MVFYIERKRRRPDECQLVECGEGGRGGRDAGGTKPGGKIVLMVPKPPEFNLTRPPNPFAHHQQDWSNSDNDNEARRAKFLLYYLNQELDGGEEWRDKCNNLKIQLLAGGVGQQSVLTNPVSLSHLPSSPHVHHNHHADGGGEDAGYNYIRSKIVGGASSQNESRRQSTLWSNDENVAAASNRSLNDQQRTSLNNAANNINNTRGYINANSNLFSSFLYSFSILFVLFIFLFFIYLYYSRLVLLVLLSLVAF